MNTILDDSRIAPQVFLWNGRPNADHLYQRIAELGWTVPSDIVAFWIETGGGDVFETEELLCPTQQNYEDLTWPARQAGLPEDWVVFHIGWGTSVVRQSTVDFAVVEINTHRVRHVYRSFDEWYRRYLRAEYATRYGLK
jgi:hypothetical protein